MLTIIIITDMLAVVFLILNVFHLCIYLLKWLEHDLQHMFVLYVGVKPMFVYLRAFEESL